MPSEATRAKELAGLIAYHEACKGTPAAEQDDDGEIDVWFYTDGRMLAFHFHPGGKIHVVCTQADPQESFSLDLMETLRALQESQDAE